MVRFCLIVFFIRMLLKAKNERRKELLFWVSFYCIANEKSNFNFEN